jgi:hypothetical protein
MAAEEKRAPQKPVSFELLMLLLSPGTTVVPLPKVEEVKRICESGSRPAAPQPAPGPPTRAVGGPAST